MTAAQSQAYLRTRVQTASPAELRLMLLDGAVRFARQAQAGFASRDFESALDGTTKCQAILAELICSLRPEHGAELCQRLSALYTFMYKRMVDSSLAKDPVIAQEVIGLLEYERETWSLLMAKLSAEGSGQINPETPGDQTSRSRVSVKV